MPNNERLSMNILNIFGEMIGVAISITSSAPGCLVLNRE